MLKRAVPRPVEGFTPPPFALGEGLWVLDRRLRHFGMGLLPSRSTIVRLGNGKLVVVSPPALLDAETAAAIDALGSVDAAVLPNPFHYVYAEEFSERYPAARALAVPGLAERVPELGAVETLGPDPPVEWAGELDVELIGPEGGPYEAMLFHFATGTLILTDVAFNMTEYPRTFDRFFWRLNGLPGKFGPGRTSRTLLLRDRETASRALARMLEWPIRRIVVVHGEIVETDAMGALCRAFEGYLSHGAGS